MVTTKKTTKVAKKTNKTKAKVAPKAAPKSKAKAKGLKGILHKLNKRIAIGSLVILAVAAAVGWRYLPSLSAESILWSSGTPVTVSNQDLGADSSWRDACQAKFHTIKSTTPLLTADPTTKTDCVLGAYNDNGIYTYAQQQAIGYQPAGDPYAYRTTASCAPACVYLPSKDTLVRVESNNSLSTGRVAIYSNFTSRLSLVDQGGTDKFYAFDSSNPELISDYGNEPGYVGLVRWIQRSSNDQWLVMDFAGAGLVRVDLNASPKRFVKFSNWATNYTYQPPTIEFDITDDGQHVAVLGNNADTQIYDITSECGSVTTSLTEAFIQTQQAVPCPVLNLKTPDGTIASNVYMPSMANAYQPVFSADGVSITFYGSSADGVSNRLMTLRAANYNPSPSPSPTPTPPLAAGPKTKDECKKDNWKSFGSMFKNQGDCVSAVEAAN